MNESLEAVYRDLHAHPELGMAEHRTAAIIAQLMTEAGLEVTTGVGGTGVVAVLRNNVDGDDGPVVGLRADMDALPILEQTGLDYASRATVRGDDGVEIPVMHACGHDMHVTCLVGAVQHLVACRHEWRGTVVAIFQPAEETLAGAQAMVVDGIADRFPRPEILLGQHVAPLPAGVVSLHSGTTLASVDSFDITFTGRGGHGSRPQTTIDPIVAASATVMRLQTVVAREVEPGTLAVVTVGTFHAGTKNNVIPATAKIGVNVRALDADTRAKVVGAIRRIASAEALASGMVVEPIFTIGESGDATVNDAVSTERLRARFAREFEPDGESGARTVLDIGAASGSEDVGELANAFGVPLVFWFFGGSDPQAFAAAVAAGRVDADVPSNHSPYFAPVIRPTIDAGVQYLTVAALEWLAPV
ncbi:amidohydrolase [Subtercola sp. PAMC28395]|uniref:amidohydrolase n=1 Tax=Subtercola sp. PAMC28395 TaxID=2846775 RepID=UPI001C0C792A|nr:amidohydrolase [Subtercola sp. PAMC28395]QWT22695.1 amidohydrolase [Subtercola sp. PAMC28395]